MGAMLALSAIFAVVITSVTLTQERAIVEAQSAVTVDLSKPTANPGEDSGSVSVTVTLGALASAAVNIPLTVTAGTALESTATTNPQNNDYDVPDLSQATVSSGDTTGTMSIALVADDVDEPQESFTVSLGTLPSGYTAGTTTSVTIYINDGDNSPASNASNMKIQSGSPLADASGATVGTQLTAVVSSILDADYPDDDTTNDVNESSLSEIVKTKGTLTYQWIRIRGTRDTDPLTQGDTADVIVGTSKTYTPDNDDVGFVLTVEGTWSDEWGNGDATPEPLDTDNQTALTATTYNMNKPYIIKGTAADGDPLKPGIVLTGNNTGLLLGDHDNNGTSDALMNTDGTTFVDTDLAQTGIQVLQGLANVTFTWQRNGTAIMSLLCGETTGDTTAEICAFPSDSTGDNDRNYTLTDDDVSETITLVATYSQTPATGSPVPVVHSTSDSAGTIISTNAATGKPEITGTTQVGSVLTASRGTIDDADGLSDTTYTDTHSYKWYRSDDMAKSIGSGSTYVIKAGDAGKTFKVVASFMDDLGDPDMRTSDPTNMVAGSPGMISKIEPGIRDVVISGGEDVVLSVEVYGLQGKMDQALADGVTLNWTTTGGSVPTDAAGNTQVTYTASSSPGTYTITAMVSDGDCQPDDESMREAACSASFEVRVRRSAPPQPEPAAPANPPGDIPTILTDSEGNQYEVFTPVEGGTFAGEGYSIVAGSGAVPNGEFIGVRMSDDGSASNAGMTHQRYTLGGNMYGVHAVDSTGASVSDYVLDEAAEVCVPLPDAFRARISDLALVTINSDGSLTILAANVRLGDGGSASVCGNLSNLPASVAVGSMGAPAAIPTATPIPTPVPPETGGSAPTSNGMLWVLVLGTAIILLGATVVLTTRRSRKSLS